MASFKWPPSGASVNPNTVYSDGNPTTTTAIARFADTTGHLIENSLATVSNAGLLVAVNLSASGQTASTVPYFDASKNLVSSAVTPTELGYLSGVTSSIQTQLNSKIGSAGSSTNTAIAKWSGTSGGVLADTGVLIDSSNNVIIPDLAKIKFNNSAGFDPGIDWLPSAGAFVFSMNGVTKAYIEDTGSVVTTHGFTTQNACVFDYNRIHSAAGEFIQVGEPSANAAFQVMVSNSALTYSLGLVNFVNNNAANAVAMITGASGQTASLMEWQNSGNGVLSKIDSAGNLTLNAQTASTVPYLDSSKKLVSSAVTPTELGYLSGVTSAIQTQINAKLTSPMTTLGDVIYGGASGTATRLAGNTTSTKNFLVQTGTGTISAAPSWGAIAAGDVPSLPASIITSGTLATANGGTNLASYTSQGIFYASNANTFAQIANGTSKQVLRWDNGTNAPLFGSIDLSSSAAVTSALGVVNGGTGSTSGAGAFSNLSPVTLTGDLIVGNGASSSTRLAIGSTGQYLKVAGGTAAWGSFTPPTVQTFLSGSGMTYTLPAGVLYIEVEMIGGGGGGGGSGTGAGTSGGAGGNSTFGSSLLVANGGGGGGVRGGDAGAGGTASLGTGPVGIAISGGVGGGAGANAAIPGGFGGNGPFGGAGSALSNGSGVSGATNTGAGGGGGYAATTFTGGAGGGAGGYVKAIITSPSATYSNVTVGVAGTAGTAGTGGYPAGAGGSGMIIVREYYS